MIQTIWVKNPSGNILELNLRSSDQEVGLIVFNLTGLGPPKATVNSSGGPNFDGVRVTSVGADARHLLLTLAVANGLILEEDAKQKIYTFFPIKQEITFGIKTDRKDVYISAIVEENEFNQFAKVENAVISLFCPAPYFIDNVETKLLLSRDAAIPLFEFPFKNDSITLKELEFGYLVDTPKTTIDYTGEVKTGVDFIFNLFGWVDDLSIANSNGSQLMILDFTDAESYFGGQVTTGDQVYLVTRTGQKSVYFVRDTVWFNMINGVGLTDDWIDIRPGINNIVITANYGIEYVETEILFRALSEGV